MDGYSCKECDRKNLAILSIHANQNAVMPSRSQYKKCKMSTKDNKNKLLQQKVAKVCLECTDK